MIKSEYQQQKQNYMLKKTCIVQGNKIEKLNEENEELKLVNELMTHETTWLKKEKDKLIKENIELKNKIGKLQEKIGKLRSRNNELTHHQRSPSQSQQPSQSSCASRSLHPYEPDTALTQRYDHYHVTDAESKRGMTEEELEEEKEEEFEDEPDGNSVGFNSEKSNDEDGEEEVDVDDDVDEKGDLKDFVVPDTDIGDDPIIVSVKKEKET